MRYIVIFALYLFYTVSSAFALTSLPSGEASFKCGTLQEKIDRTILESSRCSSDADCTAAPLSCPWDAFSPCGTTALRKDADLHSINQDIVDFQQCMEDKLKEKCASVKKMAAMVRCSPSALVKCVQKRCVKE